MDDTNVIIVDSEGDSEEHALVISDTEDDVIFVAKTDAQPKALSVSRKCCDDVSNVPLVASSIYDDSEDCVVSSTTKDKLGAMTKPKLEDNSHGKQLLTSFDGSEKATFDFCLKSDAENLSQPNPHKLDDLLCKDTSEYHSTSPDPIFATVFSTSFNEQRTIPDLLGNKKLETVNSKEVLDGLQSQNDDDNDDKWSMICCGVSDSDASSSSSSSSSLWSSVDSDDSSSSSSFDSSTKTKSVISSSISQSSVRDGINVLDTSPSIPPTPIFDKLIQFPSLEHNSCNRKTSCGKINNGKNVSSNENNIICKSVDFGNQSENSSKKRTTDLIADCTIPLKHCKLNVNTQTKSGDVLVIQDQVEKCTKLVESVPFNESHIECSLCEKLVDMKLLIRCPCDKTCCAQCIEKQITDLLAKGQKGLPKCSSAYCSGIWETDKLAKFLPPMVMVILRKKIEEETIGDIVKWLVPDGGSSKSELDDVLHLPEQWQPMAEYKEYVLVNLPSTGFEFMEIHSLFHTTMHSPRAQIQSIKRVQNPNLWRFFAMKRHIMIKERKTEHDQPVERRLFHGTKRSNLDSICRDNFDWRLSGVHGTIYGVGSYFARDASYSHQYTDRPVLVRPRQTLITTTGLIQATTPIHIQATQQITNSLFTPWASLALMTSSDPMLSQEPGKLPIKQVHHHVMFVANVLTGRFTIGRSGYRRPPPISENSHECYDSCVNCLNNPNIFVIFEKSQCYPEYIIEYTNEYHYC